MAELAAKLKHANELFQTAKYPQAKDLLMRLVRQAPADRNVNVLLRHTLTRLGEHPQALYYAEKALAAAPDDPDLITITATSLADCGRASDALTLADAGAVKHPTHGPLLATLARFYGVGEQLASALRICEQGLRARPNDPNLLSLCGTALLRSGRADEAVTVLKALAAASPGGPDPARVSTLCHALHYAPSTRPEDIFAAHHAFGRVLATALPPPPPPPFAQTFDPDRRIKVGFVSADFREHPVHLFMGHFMEKLDRSQFELFLYSTVMKEDAVTAGYKKLDATYRPVARLNVRELANLILSDRIDVLIDLGGHTAGGRLPVFHVRPAPVQATYLGYPCTTGVAAMDHRIVDSITDPPGLEAQSTERLVRIDPCNMVFRPSPGTPEVDPTPPSSRESADGTITFGSFNALAKLNDPVLRLWGRIIRQVRGSKILLKHHSFRHEEVRDMTRRRFEAAGAPGSSLIIEPPAPSSAELMASYNRIDIALDPFPYQGMTTTFESLWMGVPVVALEGHTSMSRHGLPPLIHTGLSDLIAKTEDDYIFIAERLARDVERRADLRRTLRDRMRTGPLGDEDALSRRFGAAIRQMWRERCANHQPQPQPTPAVVVPAPTGVAV